MSLTQEERKEGLAFFVDNNKSCMSINNNNKFQNKKNKTDLSDCKSSMGYNRNEKNQTFKSSKHQNMLKSKKFKMSHKCYKQNILHHKSNKLTYFNYYYKTINYGRFSLNKIIISSKQLSTSTIRLSLLLSLFLILITQTTILTIAKDETTKAHIQTAPSRALAAYFIKQTGSENSINNSKEKYYYNLKQKQKQNYDEVKYKHRTTVPLNNENKLFLPQNVKELPLVVDHSSSSLKHRKKHHLLPLDDNHSIHKDDSIRKGKVFI